MIVSATTDSAGVGGVTIHVERLMQWLRRENVGFDLCDYKRESIIKQVRKIAAHKLIHIHASHPVLRVMYVGAAKLLGKQVVFTVHGSLGRFSRWKNWLDKLAVRMSDAPILINQNSYEKALGWNKGSELVAAFIPPIEAGTIPAWLATAIADQRRHGRRIAVTNASVRSFTAEGKEIYGIDFLVGFFRVADGYSLIISDPSGQYTELYKNENCDHLIFVKEPHSFFALTAESDMMLRATATDGDSLSVKEGLYLGKKVVATDCVDRPKGVVLFRYGDAASLAEALNADCRACHFEDEKAVNKIIDIYNNLLK